MYLVKEEHILKPNKEDITGYIYVLFVRDGWMNLNDFVLSRYLVQVSEKYYTQGDAFFLFSPITFVLNF